MASVSIGWPSLRMGRFQLLTSLSVVSLLVLSWYTPGRLGTDTDHNHFGQERNHQNVPPVSSEDHREYSKNLAQTIDDDELANQFLQAAYDRDHAPPPHLGPIQQDGQFFQAMDDSDFLFDTPPWDPDRPLPAWYTETQEFIARLEKEDRPYPMFEKFMAFDLHIWLGLNNIRYILEMTNMYGVLLNRTVIIPSNIYARSCHQYELCKLSGRLVNLAEITDPFFGRWELDFKTFWDVEGMRKTLNVLTSVEFNRVMLVKHGIIVEDPEAWISSHGGDLRLPRSLGLLKVYHDLDRSISVDSRTILPDLYAAPPGITIVDDVTPLLKEGRLPHRESMLTKHEHERVEVWKVKETIEMSIQQIYKEELPMRWEKNRLDDNATVANGILPLGFKQMYESEATILHLQAGVHNCGRSPFSFTTDAALQRYENIILRELPVPQTIKEARDHVYSKLQELLAQDVEVAKTLVNEKGNNGRRIIREGPPRYAGFHFRRGDFIEARWTDNISTQSILNRIIYSLWELQIQETGEPMDPSCDVDFTNILDDNSDQTPAFWAAENTTKSKVVPWDKIKTCIDRRFYFSTDETAPEFINTLRKAGGICIEDLMDDTFIVKYLQILPFGDYIGLLDQWILAHSENFFGSPMSSFTGGVFNLRKGLGIPMSQGRLLTNGFYGLSTLIRN